ncbi:MAG: hypothetical protein Q7R40_14275 [Phaeospirillum sp.]|nr:hypothetical protein [Phaeospirillum sp.]
MFRNTLARRLTSLVLAGSLIAAALAGCGGSHTNRPLRVRVTYGFPYLEARTAPQPLVDVFYRWNVEPGQLLMEQRAGSGSMTLEVQHPAIRGNSYVLEVWVVRGDTDQQIGYASLPIVVPQSGEPYTSNINLRGRAAGTVPAGPNPNDPVLTLVPGLGP